MNRKRFLYSLLSLLAAHLVLRNLKNFRTSFLTDHPSDLDVATSELIRAYAGVSEVHQIETQDGYYLKIFRIPRTNPKGVILLQHPVYTDSRIWIYQNDSVAYVFWRAGYDVWLGNTRGNVFGRKHLKLQKEERAFWNYSFHEMGYYDNLAITQYIKEKSNDSKIIYLGYSMGANSGMVYASTRSKEAAESIKLMLLIAPCAYITKCPFPFSYLVPGVFRLQKMFNVDVEFPMMRSGAWHLRLFKFLLNILPSPNSMSFLHRLLFHWLPDEVDSNLTDMVAWVIGSETSWKVVDHFTQIYTAGGEFRMYDYGEEQNSIVYGNSKPPLYPLESIKVPTFLIYGDNDEYVDVEDNEKLYGVLSKNSTVGKMLIEGFYHSDFIVEKESNEKVYHKILRILEDV